MTKLIYFRFISVYMFFMCINLIHTTAKAQTPANPTANLPITNLPTINPPPQAPPTEPVATPVTPAVGKYAEYQSYCRQNDFDETIVFSDEQKQRRLDLLEKKLKTNSTNKLIINALIKEYLGHKDIKMAEEIFKKNKDLLSSEDNIIWSAEFDFQKKLYLSATSKLEKFIIENPNSKAALLNLAKIKKSLLFFSDATDIFLDLKSANKKADYSTELCELYALNSNHAEAEKICPMAIAKYPENPLPEIFLGISYREQEMFKDSQLHFENSLKIRKTEFGLTCLGELFFLKKDRKKTIDYLTQAVEKNKFSYRAQMGLAIAEFEDKKYDVALVHFKEACLLNPKDTLEMRKSHQILEDQKIPLAKNYFDEIQKCKLQLLF